MRQWKNLLRSPMGAFPWWPGNSKKKKWDFKSWYWKTKDSRRLVVENPSFSLLTCGSWDFVPIKSLVFHLLIAGQIQR